MARLNGRRVCGKSADLIRRLKYLRVTYTSRRVVSPRASLDGDGVVEMNSARVLITIFATISLINFESYARTVQLGRLHRKMFADSVNNIGFSKY